jgi:transketolase
VEALFVTLADKGFFPESDLNTLCRYKSHYIGHPTKKVNGIEQNTGALGHGLPIAVDTAHRREDGSKVAVRAAFLSSLNNRLSQYPKKYPAALWITKAKNNKSPT